MADEWRMAIEARPLNAETHSIPFSDLFSTDYETKRASSPTRTMTSRERDRTKDGRQWRWLMDAVGNGLTRRMTGKRLIKPQCLLLCSSCKYDASTDADDGDTGRIPVLS